MNDTIPKHYGANYYDAPVELFNETEEFKCMRCGKEVEAEFVDNSQYMSVDPTGNILLSGEYVCPNCGKRHRVVQPYIPADDYVEEAIE